MSGENNFTEESPSATWLHGMIKINASNYFHETLISKWTSWTKAKFILINIGLVGRYDGGSFSNYNMKKIKQCLGLLIFNGLIIYPRVEYKFKLQDSDPINVSDLVHALFGAKAAKIFKLFKLLFAV